MSKSRLCDISFVSPTLRERYLSERALRSKLGHWLLNLGTDSHLPWNNLEQVTYHSELCFCYLQNQKIRVDLWFLIRGKQQSFQATVLKYLPFKIAIIFLTYKNDSFLLFNRYSWTTSPKISVQ